MSNLIEQMDEFLKSLEPHDEAVRVTDVHPGVLRTARQQNLVERPETGYFKLSDEGREYLRRGNMPTEIVKLEDSSSDDAEEFNPAPLIHRLLTTQSIDVAELTSKAEQKYMSGLLRDVIVTRAGSTYVPTATGRRTLEHRLSAFSQPVDQQQPKPAPRPVQTVQPQSEQEAPERRKRGRKPGQKNAPKKAGAPVKIPQPYLMAADNLQEKFVPSTTTLVIPATEEKPCDGCNDCLPRRVLDAVMEVNPDVRKLFEAMQSQDVLLKKLKAR